MKNVQIYANRIGNVLDAYKPVAQKDKFLEFLHGQGIDTTRPILYGYDATRSLFWFRNDTRGEMIQLPLQKVKVWPDGTQPRE